MIRNEREYQEAVERIRQENDLLAKQESELKGMGLGPAEVKRAMDPVRTFHLQLDEEVQEYERLKRGELQDLLNLRGLGTMLVSLRIALGLTQRQLAERLGVHETQVSRDERNEYHGITLDRATRILEALGVEVRSRVELPEPQQDKASVA